MSHNSIILQHLESGKPITGLMALTKYGCFRLASRINELKNYGHNIKSKMIYDKKNGKRWKAYWL